MNEKLYDLWHSSSNDTMPWAVCGSGFGLRCFRTKEDAINAATDYFGQVRFSLTIWPNRTQLRVVAAPECDPRRAIDQAIVALQAERDALENCPIHRAAESPEKEERR